MVYLVRHNGGSVWVDELGGEWPKHACFDTEPRRVTVALPTLASARGGQRRRSTGTGVKPNPHTDLVKPAHKTLKPASGSTHAANPSAVVAALDKLVWRQCEFCSTPIKLPKYRGHLLKRCPKRGVVADVMHHLAPALTVQGIGGKSVELTSADLSKAPQHTINAADQGMPATFEGVRLSDVLAHVDVPTGERFYNTAAWYYLLVEATNGNRAVFAWAELDPTFMDKVVYVVTKRDGRALSETDGPFQLVVPGEKRNARWIRQVTALRIRQAS